MTTVLLVVVLSRILHNWDVKQINWKDELLVFGFNLYISMTVYVILKAFVYALL
jgi:hypothetical protein